MNYASVDVRIEREKPLRVLVSRTTAAFFSPKLLILLPKFKGNKNISSTQDGHVSYIHVLVLF